MDLLPILALVGLTLAVALVLAELRRAAAPPNWRVLGVVVRRPDVLDAHGEVIGQYMGREIWRDVEFKGLHYAYDHVAAMAERDHTGRGELFLEPGIVYVLTHSPQRPRRR